MTLYGRAENNLPKSFIARPKQLQGFIGFKTEIQVRTVLSFLSWTVYIWTNFRLQRFNFAFLYYYVTSMRAQQFELFTEEVDFSTEELSISTEQIRQVSQQLMIVSAEEPSIYKEQAHSFNTKQLVIVSTEEPSIYTEQAHSFNTKQLVIVSTEEPSIYTEQAHSFYTKQLVIVSNEEPSIYTEQAHSFYTKQLVIASAEKLDFYERGMLLFLWFTHWEISKERPLTLVRNSSISTEHLCIL